MIFFYIYKFVEYFDDIDAPNNSAIYGQYFETSKDKYEINNMYTSVKKNVIKYEKLICLRDYLQKCEGAQCRNYDKEYKVDCAKSISVTDYNNNLTKDSNDINTLAAVALKNNFNILNPKAKTDLNTDNKSNILDLIYLLSE